MAKTRKCTICDTEYEYCPRCRQYASMPRWYISFCGENCKDVYNITNAYSFDHISAEEAKEKLDSCDITNVTNKMVKDILNKIAKATLITKNEVAETETKKIKKKESIKTDNKIVNLDY